MFLLSATIPSVHQSNSMHDQPAAGGSKPQPVTSLGGLRRMPSSFPTLGTKPCSFANPPVHCGVQAKQVEMDFANLSNQTFQLTVLAPNGERSSAMDFSAYGQTANFCPSEAGCGHGAWKMELQDNNQKILVSENMFLDGVGTLFFTIDDHLKIRLSDQEFLRLPSATRQCTHSTSSLQQKRS